MSAPDDRGRSGTADRRGGGAVDVLERGPVAGQPVGARTAGGRGSRWRRGSSWPRGSGWRRRLVVVLALLLVVGVLAASAWLVFVSRVLDTRAVRVEGTTAPDTDRVLAAAAVPTGGPVARVDTRAVAGRVLALPGVAAVQVSRHLPHTVVVRVTERVPVAVLATTGGGRDLVDADAVVWVPPGPVPGGLPVLLDPDGSLDAADVAAAVRVATSLPPSLRSRVRGLVVPSPGSVALVLEDDRVVVWGGPDRVSRKSREADVLLADTRARYVDVSLPDAPVTRATVPPGLVPAR